jgi:pimeloyl-ACP methyl ester carboxylesterase
MQIVTSRDGTTIAFEQTGVGPALILVGGMFEQRALDTETARLAANPLLAQYFTVIHYDRRGRGDSGDTLPFAVAREIDDLAALIDAAGGQACLFGISSGAALAFEAALALGDKVRRLAIYEPPYNDDPEARAGWRVFRQDLTAALAEGRRADAVGLLMMLMGVPAEQLPEMQQYPMWPMWEAVAPTIAYDAAALGDEAAVPAERAARLATPTLILDGELSYPFMHASADALAQAMPHALRRTLLGQTHEVAPEALSPMLLDFFQR